MKWLLACLFLVGCASVPPQIVTKVQTVTVHVPVYQKLPSQLIQRCPVAEPPDPSTITNVFQMVTALGHLAAQRGAALNECNNQLSAIRKLNGRHPRTP